MCRSTPGVKGAYEHRRELRPGDLYGPDVLRRAWLEVRANQGAPGVDAVTIADIEAAGAEEFLDSLAESLRMGPTVRSRCGGSGSPNPVSRGRCGRWESPAAPIGWSSRPSSSSLSRSWRPTSCPAATGSARSAVLGREKLNATFIKLVRQVGLERAGSRARPRPYDLRHAFCVHTLIDWYRAGENVDRRMPLLSTYLGHVDPASTYWCLEAVPELLQLVSERMERVPGASS